VKSYLNTPCGDDSHVKIQLISSEGGDINALCSEYCRKLSPSRQLKIIRELLLEENGSESKIVINKGDRGVANQRKFIIDAKWWRRWCDYTGFNQIDHILIDTNINGKH